MTASPPVLLITAFTRRAEWRNTNRHSEAKARSIIGPQTKPVSRLGMMLQRAAVGSVTRCYTTANLFPASAPPGETCTAVIAKYLIILMSQVQVFMLRVNFL